MPADTSIENCGTGLRNLMAQCDHLLDRRAAFHQINHRQAKDDDEVTANRLAHLSDNLNGQTNSVFIASAPVIRAVICAKGDELVEQIPLRAHNLHPVISGRLRQLRGAHEIGDLLFNPGLIQFFGFDRIDRSLQR